MTQFIQILMDALGTACIHESTSIRVYQDNDFKIFFPELSSEDAQSGIPMTVGDLEEMLSSTNRDDQYGNYNKELIINPNYIEAESEDSVILYGLNRSEFENLLSAY